MKILVILGVCIFTLVGFKAFKAVSNPMNKKREEFQSKGKREKILLSIEQALVWTAIWSFIAGLFYYFVATYLDGKSAVLMALSLEMILMVLLGSLVRDWAYYIRVTTRKYGAYSFNQSTYSSPASPRRRFNVNGSPMMGRTDIHGNPYGVSND
jgi:small-conductance mechanosensitive channel